MEKPPRLKGRKGRCISKTKSSGRRAREDLQLPLARRRRGRVRGGWHNGTREKGLSGLFPPNSELPSFRAFPLVPIVPHKSNKVTPQIETLDGGGGDLHSFVGGRSWSRSRSRRARLDVGALGGCGNSATSPNEAGGGLSLFAFKAVWHGGTPAQLCVARVCVEDAKGHRGMKDSRGGQCEAIVVNCIPPSRIESERVASSPGRPHPRPAMSMWSLTLPPSVLFISCHSRAIARNPPPPRSTTSETQPPSWTVGPIAALVIGDRETVAGIRHIGDRAAGDPAGARASGGRADRALERAGTRNVGDERRQSRDSRGWSMATRQRRDEDHPFPPSPMPSTEASSQLPSCAVFHVIDTFEAPGDLVPRASSSPVPPRPCNLTLAPPTSPSQPESFLLSIGFDHAAWLTMPTSRRCRRLPATDSEYCARKGSLRGLLSPFPSSEYPEPSKASCSWPPVYHPHIDSPLDPSRILPPGKGLLLPRLKTIKDKRAGRAVDSVCCRSSHIAQVCPAARTRSPSSLYIDRTLMSGPRASLTIQPDPYVRSSPPPSFSTAGKTERVGEREGGTDEQLGQAMRGVRRPY